MKTHRVIHMRAPLLLRRYIGKREVSPQFDPAVSNFNGGCTVVISPTDDPFFVKVQVAWCRWSDNYCRKLGVLKAKEAVAETVALRHLSSELRLIEDQMLMNLHVSLRTCEKSRDPLLRDWNHVVRYLLPVTKTQAPQ
jgi:hypothetical protein